MWHNNFALVRSISDFWWNQGNQALLAASPFTLAVYIVTNGHLLERLGCG